MEKKLPKHINLPNIKYYEGDNWVCLDFECTTLDKGHAKNKDNKLVCAVIYGPKIGEHKFLCTEHTFYDQAHKLIEEADFIVAHHAKFELQWLYRCGFKLENILVWCTLLGEYVMAGNRPHRLNLTASCGRHKIRGKESLVDGLIKSGVCPSEIDTKLLVNYCAIDVRATAALFHRQYHALKVMGLLPAQYTRCLVTPAIAEMEMMGMHLDGEKVESLVMDEAITLANVEGLLNDITGGINMNSPKQVAAFLYDELDFEELKVRRGGKWVKDRSPAGGRKTGAETIDKLVSTNDKQSTFLTLRKKQAKLSKRLSTYLGPFNTAVQSANGIIRGNLNQSRTGTHRLSSSEPNMQNIDRTLKKLFCSRIEGWSMSEVDYAQLEFRVAAFLGQDKAAMKDIADKIDVHTVTAEIIFGSGGKVNRQKAKAHTFKPLYGGQSGTPKEKAYYKFFREKYTGITAAQESWKKEVLNTGKLETETLIFYWPDTTMSSSGYISNSTQICNYRVQSLATAEIVLVGLAYLWHRMKAKGMKSFLVNTIHDSIIGEIHPDEEGDWLQVTNTALIWDVQGYMNEIYNIDLNVPLEIEVDTGTHLK